ncbi:MAG: hypothetical protein AABY22_19280, partial [Nanoarchaeota archaeon]
MKLSDFNILFITEKFTDGNSSQPLSNTYHNLFGSFKRSFPDIKFNVVHYDELFLTHKKHINNIIENVYQKYKPNIIFCSLLLNSDLNPSVEALKVLKDKGCYICFFWPDIQQAFGIKELKQYDEAVNLHVSHAGERNLENNDKIMWLWTPQDPKLYYPGNNNYKTIPVSFIGSVRYTDRQQHLQYAIDQKVPLF